MLIALLVALALNADVRVDPAATIPTPPPCERRPRVTSAVMPEYPVMARDLNFGPATVLVKVSFDAKGVVKATIERSSGNMPIDMAAVRAARASSYQLGLHKCKPAAGSLIFTADFNPD